MSELNLTDLAVFAAANNNSRATRTPLHELSIEDARAKVKIRDGNKVKKEGVQALTLVLGKHTLPLDAIAPKATRLNITDEQVEDVTGRLTTAIEAGVFDEVIVAAQAKSVPKPKAPVEADPSEMPEGVDLDALADDGLED